MRDVAEDKSTGGSITRGERVGPEDARARVDRLAWWLDESIRLPGGFRVGYDGLIGLIPGVGDVVGMAMSSYIVLQARRMGVSNAVMLRMLLNLAIEAIAGAVPVLGDLFDFAFKANRRNVALLQQSSAQPQRTRRSSVALVAAVVAVLALVLVGSAVLVFRLLSWLWGVVF